MRSTMAAAAGARSGMAVKRVVSSRSMLTAARIPAATAALRIRVPQSIAASSSSKSTRMQIRMSGSSTRVAPARGISSSSLGQQVPRGEGATMPLRKSERSARSSRKKSGMNLEQLLDGLSRSELESLVQQGKVFVPTAYSMPMRSTPAPVVPIASMHLGPDWQERVMSRVKAATSKSMSFGSVKPAFDSLMNSPTPASDVVCPEAKSDVIYEENQKGEQDRILLYIPGTEEPIPLLLSSVLKKRRLKIKKHKHRKRLKLKRKNTKTSRS